MKYIGVINCILNSCAFIMNQIRVISLSIIMSSRGRGGLGVAGTHSAIALRMSRDVFISRCVCSLVHPVIDQLAT